MDCRALCNMLQLLATLVCSLTSEAAELILSLDSPCGLSGPCCCRELQKLDKTGSCHCGKTIDCNFAQTEVTGNIAGSLLCTCG